MKLRFRITKDKEIRFISHLEYVKTIGRAIRRAKIPADYSQGFNPHMKYSLASALGVGVVSSAEYLEIDLAEPMPAEKAAERLKKALPRGIRVLEAKAAATGEAALMSLAAWAEYEVFVPSPQGSAQKALAFNEAAELIYAKAAPKAKEKIKNINVKDFIKDIEAKDEDGMLHLHFFCRITPSGSMKASDLLKTLNQYFALDLPVEKADIRRIALYKEDKKGNKVGMLDEI